MKTPAINTIMTYVVRMKKTVVIEVPGGNHQYMEWSDINAEPQVIRPGFKEGNTPAYGIVDCVVYLRELPKDTTYRIYTPTVDERV